MNSGFAVCADSFTSTKSLQLKGTLRFSFDSSDVPFINGKYYHGNISKSDLFNDIPPAFLSLSPSDIASDSGMVL